MQEALAAVQQEQREVVSAHGPALTFDTLQVLPTPRTHAVQRGMSTLGCLRGDVTHLVPGTCMPDQQHLVRPGAWVQEMPLLQNSISEAVRLYPPLIMLMRHVNRSFRVTTRSGQSYVIPKVCESITQLPQRLAVSWPWSARLVLTFSPQCSSGAPAAARLRHASCELASCSNKS